jgi:hypothetical protein
MGFQAGPLQQYSPVLKPARAHQPNNRPRAQAMVSRPAVSACRPTFPRRQLSLSSPPTSTAHSLDHATVLVAAVCAAYHFMRLPTAPPRPQRLERFLLSSSIDLDCLFALHAAQPSMSNQAESVLGLWT